MANWEALGTLRLEGSNWRMDAASPAGCQALPVLDCVPSGKARHLERVQVGIKGDIGRVRLEDKKPSGCRNLAVALVGVATCAGGLDRYPTMLYVETPGRFHMRGLLMLQCFADVRMRRLFMERYRWERVLPEVGEKWKGYEERAPLAVMGGLPGWRAIESTRLGLPSISKRCRPDGMFETVAEDELALVEAKGPADSPNRSSDRGADFEEGTAQLLQYFGQAQHHPGFRGRAVHSILVTAGETTGDSYRFWELWMRSSRPLTVFVREG